MNKGVIMALTVSGLVLSLNAMAMGCDESQFERGCHEENWGSNSACRCPSRTAASANDGNEETDTIVINILKTAEQSKIFEYLANVGQSELPCKSPRHWNCTYTGGCHCESPSNGFDGHR